MKPIRIIPRLDVKNNNLIKGINLEGLRVLGLIHMIMQTLIIKMVQMS